MTGELDNIVTEEKQNNQRDSLEIFENLFTGVDRETKTELTQEQIIEINKKRIIAKLLGWDSLNFALDDFMLLQISKDRKGRTEFIDGLKSERERESQDMSFGERLKNKMNFFS